MPGLRQHPLPHHDRRQKQCVLWEMSTIKSCGGGLCKCANERHRNDFIKYITPWWFENNLLTRCVSCSVRSCVSRPSPKLASSRLRQRLFGAATSQTSRRKPCYRQSDLFLDSSWLYYFLWYRSFAHSTFSEILQEKSVTKMSHFFCVNYWKIVRSLVKIL